MGIDNRGIPPLKKAVILAGGIGSRLRPLTDHTPKPLLPIQGKPILQQIIENLKHYGIDEITLAIGYKADQIKDYFKDGSQLGVKISYAIEDTPLGTGGAIKAASEEFNEPFVALNGDNLADFNYQELYNIHTKNKAKVTIGLFPVEDVTQFGIAELKGDQLIRFIEKPSKEEAPTNLNNAGVYVFEPTVLNMLPEGKSSIEYDCFEKLSPQGVVYAHKHESQWFPTDNIERYQKADTEWTSPHQQQTQNNIDVHAKLEKAKANNQLPKLTVYNRIDGPGSSLDLPTFQRSFWQLRDIPEKPHTDPDASWSIGLPRTIGISISVGTDIEAVPIEKGKLGVESLDFGFSYVYNRDAIPPTKENWLLRIMDVFNLDGVKFIIRNKFPELKSAGLGGSAAVTVGVALLANKLTGNKFTNNQIIGMAAVMENNLGVSITGTQEQSCAVYGGVRDYVWFPWGIPGKGNFYGTSIQQSLLSREDYPEVRKRMDIYFTSERYSSDVNAKWYEELKRVNGFKLHKQKCQLAYEFRQALKNKDWGSLGKPIDTYRKIRTQLASNYISDMHKEFIVLAEQNNCICFPLGAGGGSILAYSADPENLKKLRAALPETFRYIDYDIMDKGHETKNMELFQ